MRSALGLKPAGHSKATSTASGTAESAATPDNDIEQPASPSRVSATTPVVSETVPSPPTTPTEQPSVPPGTRTVAVDQVFFSTTNKRGIIEHSNSVFVNLSRFDRSQLIGAPHNLIRHPKMPGGAFRAMWDTLQDGKPFTAYVRNRAADNVEYQVYATVTPLPDGGFLSVRTRPCRTDFRDAAFTIYEKALDAEKAALADGNNRREAAIVGAQIIGEQLQAAGFSSYAEFQAQVLPAEVSARESLSAGLPDRPTADGPLSECLNAVRTIYLDLDKWMAKQDSLAAVSGQLQSVGTSLRRHLDSTTVTQELLDDLSQNSEYVALVQPLQVWMQMQAIVATTITKLTTQMDQLAGTCADTRFRVALGRLHATMMAQFSAELIDGSDAPDAAEAIVLLSTAVRDGLRNLDSQLADLHRLTDTTTADIKRTISIMGIPRELLMMWKKQADDVELPPQLAHVIPAITEGIEQVSQSLTELDSLTTQLQSLSAEHDSTTMRAQLDRVEHSLQNIA